MKTWTIYFLKAPLKESNANLTTVFEGDKGKTLWSSVVYNHMSGRFGKPAFFSYRYKKLRVEKI